MPYIIGVDEVGRGPLAGPVTVCAVAIKKNIKLETGNKKLKLKDSKKLSEKQRNEWMKWIKDMEKKGNLSYVIANVSPRVIDRINISCAANLAVTRALERLVKKKKAIKGSKVFLDGGLFPKNKKLETLNLKPKTIVHGDVLIPVVSLASIVAKVTRDKRMRWIARKYPGYFFENNVGYGTKAHIRVLKKKGYSEIHRLTFIRRFVKMSG